MRGMGSRSFLWRWPVRVDFQFLGLANAAVDVDRGFVHAHLIRCMFEGAGQAVGVVICEPIGIHQGGTVGGFEDDAPGELVVAGFFCGGVRDIADAPAQIAGIAGAHRYETKGNQHQEPQDHEENANPTGVGPPSWVPWVQRAARGSRVPPQTVGAGVGSSRFYDGGVVVGNDRCNVGAMVSIEGCSGAK